MEIFDMREFDHHELVVFGHDAASGLRAVDVKAGCAKCGACSALSTYERDFRA